MKKLSRRATRRLRRSPGQRTLLRRRLILAGSILSLVGLTVTVKSATYYWDADGNAVNNSVSFSGAGLGGSGVWDTTTPLWWDGTAAIDQAWSNTNNDTAVFTGTAGTVSLGTGITVGGLQFNTSGYVIGAAGNTNTLTFGAVTNNLVFNNVTTATFNGSFAGSVTNSLIFSSAASAGTFGATTVNFQGTGTGLTGWSGPTTVNNGITLALSQNSQALTGTSAVTLNGGSITLTNTSTAEATLNRVSNTATITSNGGTFAVYNTPSTTINYAETVGSVALATGNLNIIQGNNNTSPSTQALTLSGLTHTGAANTSTLAFAGTSLGAATQNQILITGQATTTNTILGPWATIGANTAAQTDYATYNFTGGTSATGGNTAGASNALGVQAAGVTAVANDTTWSTTFVATGNYNLNAGTTTTKTSNVNTLRYSGGAGTLTIGSTFNLNTFGILNGGTGPLLITPTGTPGSLSTPTGGGSLYLTTGAAAITVAEVISDNGGAVTVVKGGTGGLLSLAGTNTFTGGLTVNAGAVLLQNAQALGLGAGAVTVNSGGALVLQGGLNFGTKALTLSGHGTSGFQNGALVNATGSNTYAGTLSLAADATVAIDAGALNLSSTGAITGTGTLVLGGTGSGLLAGGLQTSSGGLIKSGPGTWTLSGAGTYTGSTILNAGTLIVDLSTNPTGVLGSTSPLLGNGGDLRFVGAATGASTQGLGALSLSSGVNTSLVLDPNNGTSTTVTFAGGTWDRAARATALFDYSSANTGTRTASVTAAPTGTGGATGTNKLLGYTLVKTAGGLQMGYVDGSNNISPFDSATLASTLLADSNSATTDFTTLATAYSSGTLTWTNGGALTNRAVNSLTFDTSSNGGTVDMGAASNVLTVSSGALAFQGGSNATLTGGQIATTPGDLILHHLGGAGVLTIASTITGSGVTLDGTGTVILSGNNTFGGGVQINGGVLQVGNSGALNSTTPNTVTFGAGSTGKLRLAGNNIRVAGLVTNAVSPGTTVVENASATDAFLTVNQTAFTSTTYAGLLQDGTGVGKLGLIKTGDGNIRLSNSSNSFTGDIVINAGAITISDPGQLGAGISAVSVNGLSSTLGS